MVGVPGKSKGCSTCRRRKKGCDQKRPVCGQCSASGYVCGGYQRDLTFVLHPASKAVEKAVFLPTRPRSSLLTGVSALERSTTLQQCQSLFYDVYLPHGKCECRDNHILRCGRPPNWTHVIHSFDANEASLELAFAAFSISRVGRNRDDPRLIKESTKYYGKALKHLQKALYDPSRMRTEQVLTACLLLGLYETFEGAGGKSAGWVSHAQGAARIVELRGPESHAEQPAHILFLGTRLPVIYSAILRRKRTFLGEEKWLTVPWRKESKTGIDRLIDITTHIPGLLEQLDSVRSMVPSTTQRLVLHKCLATCRSLQKSLTHWSTIRRPNSLPIAVKHERISEDDTYPFLEELTFENHLFLNANLIHWSAGLVLATTVSEIELLLTSFGFESTNVLTWTATTMQEAQDYAINIARSIPYCLWPDMGDLGIDYVQFPMCLAFQFFMKSNNSPVCSWMVKQANEMQKKGSAVVSPDDKQSMSRTSSDAGLGLFSVPEHDTGSQKRRESPRTTSSIGCSSLIDQAILPTNALTTLTIQPNSTASNPATLLTDSDFDADYDIDSDCEGQISPEGTSSAIAYCGTRASSESGPSGAQGTADSPGASTDDFAFVQENPARYYIDKSEAISSEKT